MCNCFLSLQGLLCSGFFDNNPGQDEKACDLKKRLIKLEFKSCLWMCPCCVLLESCRKFKPFCGFDECVGFI